MEEEPGRRGETKFSLRWLPMASCGASCAAREAMEKLGPILAQFGKASADTTENVHRLTLAVLDMKSFMADMNGQLGFLRAEYAALVKELQSLRQQSTDHFIRIEDALDEDARVGEHLTSELNSLNKRIDEVKSAVDDGVNEVCEAIQDK